MFSTSTFHLFHHSMICWSNLLAEVCLLVLSNSFICCGDGDGLCCDGSRYFPLTVLLFFCMNLFYFALILQFFWVLLDVFWFPLASWFLLVFWFLTVAVFSTFLLLSFFVGLMKSYCLSCDEWCWGCDCLKLKLYELLVSSWLSICKVLIYIILLSILCFHLSISRSLLCTLSLLEEHENLSSMDVEELTKLTFYF